MAGYRDTSVVLVIPEKADMDTEAVAGAWMHRGGHVRRLGKYWIKHEDLASANIAIYGPQAFALILAQLYHKTLVSPDEAFIAQLDQKWTGRRIRQLKAGAMTASDFPVFIKSLVPKVISAAIYQTQYHFENASSGLEAGETLLVSEIIDDIVAEARAYVMDAVCKDMALYQGGADQEEGLAFLNRFLLAHSTDLPQPVVIDLGYSKRKGWFVIELNACWGAGLNGCRAEKVIGCIIHATTDHRAGTTGAELP